MRIFDSSKREHAKMLNTQRNMTAMENDKTVGEQPKKHWRHKPYECDFGGGKNDY
jgi:hypothetical protein